MNDISVEISIDIVYGSYVLNGSRYIVYLSEKYITVYYAWDNLGKYLFHSKNNLSIDLSYFCKDFTDIYESYSNSYFDQQIERLFQLKVFL